MTRGAKTNADAATRRRVAALHAAYAAAAEPARASGMQAYMKSAMPFLGLAAPHMRRIAREHFRAWWPLDAHDWRATVEALWDTATRREHRYAALELLAWPQARAHRTRDILAVVERFAVEGAWWDYVDAMARVTGEILRRDRKSVATLRRWSRDDNLWLRRSAILAQLDAKAETDVDLLYELIQPSIAAREFFLRKAIGWALRQLARTQPDAVRAYVAAHEHELSTLSRREALKHLG